jgi:dolichol-phosphate mannosyltransferase
MAGEEMTKSVPEVTVVVPVHDEAANLRVVIEEIEAALAGRLTFEMVYVDDGSADATPDLLAELAAAFPTLRVVRHAVRAGQSAAILSGVEAARAPLIATLDGDGQNDPADIPRLIEIYRNEGGGDGFLMIAGQRAERQDRAAKRWASFVANWVRARLLGDGTPDTGCGLKVFARAAFLRLPEFDHMHRFLPALMLRAGGRVLSVPVAHRPRAGGASKYGVLDRLWMGIVDLMGVLWLKRRALRRHLDGGSGGERE